MKKLNNNSRKRLKQTAVLLVLVIAFLVLDRCFEGALWNVVIKGLLCVMILGLALTLLKPGGYQRQEEQDEQDERMDHVPESGTWKKK